MTTTPYTVEAWKARALAAEADADRLRELGLQYAYQSGLYARRMTEAQAARDRLRAELEALRELERVTRDRLAASGVDPEASSVLEALDAARSQHSEEGLL